MDAIHLDAETLRLIGAFQAIADEQIRQGIVEIVQTAARWSSSIEQNAIEVFAHLDPHKAG